ncbi:Holliday junction resolvase RecU [Brevibacillus fluminis]|uniref:Holliday junction resolvase RecU n=1 Tax=Brevibacillus fluminis TaxID=511487 RepID=UPI003F895306
MRRKSSQANRGQAFEGLLNFTNKQYNNAGVALINKRPTPLKPIRQQGFHVLAAYDQKSTVDYDGIYKGRAIFFEAKSTREQTSFPLKNIERHQIEYLENAEKQGGICFFLIEFAVTQEVFFLPLATVRQYMLHAQSGGRKSIPKDDFEYYAYLVPQTKRAVLDYLVWVDKLIGEAA